MVNTVRIKICGITRPEDAALAVRLGADALGFNFWSGSKRHVTPQAAREIVRSLPPFTTPVGVFVNPSQDEVLRAVDASGIRVVQLHGDESPEFCARLPLPVVKALRVDTVSSLAALASYEVAAFLLDTPTSGFGGSGVAFDWSLAEGVSESVAVILAGGLDASNVARAIRAVRPYGVDVASGVERAPGVKDPEKMARFIEAVRTEKEIA